MEWPLHWGAGRFPMGFFPWMERKRSELLPWIRGSPYALHCGVISDVTASQYCKAPLCSFGVSPFLQLVILNPWKGKEEGMICVYLKRRINLSPSSLGDPEEAVLSLHWFRPAAVCCGAFLVGQVLTNSVSQRLGRR